MKKELNKYTSNTTPYELCLKSSLFTREISRPRKLPECFMITHRNAVAYNIAVAICLRRAGFKNYRHAYTATPDGQIIDVINLKNMDYKSTQE